jgi:trimeric autotransporter adhesin
MPSSTKAIAGGFSRLLILTSILLIAAACDQSSTQVVESISIQGELRVTPGETVIDNGSTIQLEAHRVFPDGRSIPATGPITWTSSSSAVGTVNSSGVVTGRLPGEVTIRAESSRGSATAKVEILAVSSDLRLEVEDEIEVEAEDGADAPVAARVVDVAGRAVSGVQVDFHMIDDSGEVVSLRRVTGADGFANASVPVGTAAGEYDLEITSPGFASSAASAVENGGAQVAANNGQLRRNVRILVRPSRPDLVRVSPESSSIEVGEVEYLDVEVIDNFGNEIHDATLTWSTGNGEVVDVNGGGELTGLSAGETMVTVQATDDRGRTADGSATVEVRAGAQPKVAAAQVHSGDGQSGTVGETLSNPLAVRVLDEQGHGVSGVSVKWAVSTGSAKLSRASSTTDSGGIASVDVELGSSVGTVEVRAEVSSVAAVTFRITATAGEVASIELSPGSLTLDPGGTHRLTATADDAFGNPIASPSLTWSSSSSNIAAVNSEGRVTALVAGTTTITARSGDQVGMAEVQVSGGDEAVSLHIDASTTDLTALGETVQLELSARNADGGAASLPTSVNWSSSDSNVASVNSSGRVIANAVGTAIIGVAAACCTGDSVTVRVTQDVASVEVSPSTGTLQVGEQIELSAEGLDSRGNTVSDTEVTWSSGSTWVATVNSSGVVSGVEVGHTTITASVNGYEATAAIQVESADSDGEDASSPENPGQVTDLQVASTAENSVTLRFTEVSDGDGGAANYQIRYRASSEFGNWGTAAVVRDGSCGEPVAGISVGNVRECQVPGLSAGTDHTFRMVSRRAEDGGWVFGPLSNIAGGTTDAADNGSGDGNNGSGDDSNEPASLHISAPTTSLTALDETVQLSVSAEDSDGNGTDLPSSLTWSSSDPAVASVNSVGRVTANAVGTAAIAVAAACCTGDDVIIHVSQEVASVQVSPSSLTLDPGQSRTLSAAARDANGNSIPGVSVDWSSTDSSVLSVNASGVVTAGEAGTAAVRALAAGAVGQASVSVTNGSDSAGPGSGDFPNAPSGWNTLIDSDFNYATVEYDPAGSGWFSISDSRWGGRAPDTRPVGMRTDANGPISAPHAVRFDFPEGAPDGSSPAGRMFSESISATTTGVYFAYTMRLSPNWSQNPTGTPGNPLKHVEFGSSGNLVMRTGITKIPDDPQDRFRMSMGNTYSGGTPTFVLDNSTAFHAGDWVTVEVLVLYNESGVADSGSIEMWVNGNLAATQYNVNYPFTTFSGIQAANVFGGGIGSVPHDQWKEFDHFYVSVR